MKNAPKIADYTNEVRNFQSTTQLLSITSEFCPLVAIAANSPYSQAGKLYDINESAVTSEIFFKNFLTC